MHRAALATVDENAPTRFSQKYTACDITKVPNQRVSEAEEYLQIIYIVNDMIDKPLPLMLTLYQHGEYTAGKLKAKELDIQGTEKNPIKLYDLADQAMTANIRAGIDQEKNRNTQFVLTNKKLNEDNKKWNLVIEGTTHPVIAQVVIPNIYYRLEQ